MAMAMASKKKRNEDNRVYVVSGMLFLCIVVGGALLGMYITLPESQTAVWYPVAGMLLVGIPWIFWLLTFTYSCCSCRIRSTRNNQNNKQQHLTKTLSNTSSPVVRSASAESARAGHVKFGATTVMGEENDQQGHTVGTREAQQDDGQGKGGEERHEEFSMSSSATDNGQSSFSVKSHESEQPLKLSISSQIG